MSRRIELLLAAFAWLMACLVTSSGAQPRASSMLFDGKGLAGWTRLGDANWRIADGAVEADAGNGFLVTEGSYGDFDLKLEFWVSDDANSGVFLRCSDPQQVGAATCYEVNIFDQRPDQDYRTGGIVDVAKPAAVVDTGGRWNSYEISARGAHLRVVLNGQTVVDIDDDTYAEGPIALQYGAGAVKFRNVEITAG